MAQACHINQRRCLAHLRRKIDYTFLKYVWCGTFECAKWWEEGKQELKLLRTQYSPQYVPSFVRQGFLVIRLLGSPNLTFNKMRHQFVHWGRHYFIERV